MTGGETATLLKAVSTYLPRFVVEMALSETRGSTEATLGGAFLRADVSGFTETTERLAARGKAGAQEVQELLNRFYTALLGVAFLQGAEPLGFGGDAVTLAFLRPGGEGDGPGGLAVRRAIAAGLAMQAAMGAFSRVETSAGPLGLSLRVGVEAGTCSASTVGEGRGLRPLVTGRALEAASTAEAAAAPGEVVAGPEALARVGRDGLARVLPGGLGVLGAVPGGDPPQVPQEDLALPLIFDDAGRTEAALERLSAFLIEGVYARILESPERLRPAGEFRYVAVLFVTLAARGGEGDRGDLRPWTAAVQGLAREHGGSLHKVDMEKGVHRWMLVFGAPVAVEAPPSAALRCVEALRRLPGGVRAGMDAGYVFAGNVGHPVRQEYTVIGDAVNVAARVAALAKDGEVLLGPGLSGAMGGEFPLEALGPVRLKGKREPVPLHRLASAAPPGPGRAAPPLAGREEERAVLGRAVSEAAEGRGSALVLEAEAGMGKTRLMDWALSEAPQPGMVALRVTAGGPEAAPAFGLVAAICPAAGAALSDHCSPRNRHRGPGRLQRLVRRHSSKRDRQAGSHS